MCSSDLGRGLFAEAGLPTPTIFEAPHYAATDATYHAHLFRKPHFQDLRDLLKEENP